MHETNVQLQTPDGIIIRGILSLPSEHGRFPMIISCHGFGSGKNNKTNRLLIPLLIDKGIGTIRFDFRGHYDSEGNIAELTVSNAMIDLHTVVEYIKNHSSYAIDRLGIFSTSFGSSVALLHEERYQSSKVMIMKAPISDYAQVRTNQLGVKGIKEWATTGVTEIDSSKGKIKSNYDFYLDSLKLELLEKATKIRAKCLIFHNKDDDNVPFSQSIDLQKRIPNSILEMGDCGNHNFELPGQLEELVIKSISFFTYNL